MTISFYSDWKAHSEEGCRETGIEASIWCDNKEVCRMHIEIAKWKEDKDTNFVVSINNQEFRDAEITDLKTKIDRCLEDLKTKKTGTLEMFPNFQFFILDGIWHMSTLNGTIMKVAADEENLKRIISFMESFREAL